MSPWKNRSSPSPVVPTAQPAATGTAPTGSTVDAEQQAVAVEAPRGAVVDAGQVHPLADVPAGIGAAAKWSVPSQEPTW